LPVQSVVQINRIAPLNYILNGNRAIDGSKGKSADFLFSDRMIIGR
jgi:hypothetical protein